MRTLLIIFVIFSVSLKAQDKLFFSNGTVKKGIIISIAKDVVYFKLTDTSGVEKIDKSGLIMSENYQGVRFIFYNAPKAEEDPFPPTHRVSKFNSIGMQPLALLIGRATVVYEKLSKDEKIGFVFPLSLTFDPSGKIYNTRVDPNQSGSTHIPGVNFIGGFDVNFYVGQNEHNKFFIGPRLRYGTDLLLGGIEAVTLQTQMGWRIGKPTQLVNQYLSFGFGVANIIAIRTGRLLKPKQFYGWLSVNYRLAINW